MVDALEREVLADWQGRSRWVARRRGGRGIDSLQIAHDVRCVPVLVRPIWSGGAAGWLS